MKKIQKSRTLAKREKKSFPFFLGNKAVPRTEYFRRWCLSTIACPCFVAVVIVLLFFCEQHESTTNSSPDSHSVFLAGCYSETTFGTSLYFPDESGKCFHPEKSIYPYSHMCARVLSTNARRSQSKATVLVSRYQDKASKHTIENEPYVCMWTEVGSSQRKGCLVPSFRMLHAAKYKSVWRGRRQVTMNGCLGAAHSLLMMCLKFFSWFLSISVRSHRRQSLSKHTSKE